MLLDTMAIIARRVLPRHSAAGDRLRRLRHRLRPAAGDGPFDAVLDAFGRSHPRASFVQVGSNDGVRFDPISRQLRVRAWHGLMVEPLPWLFTRLEANFGGFRRLQLVNAAVGDHDGTQPLYHLAPHEGPLGDLPPWYDALGSFRREVVLSHVGAIPDVEDRLRVTEVATLTFASLCERHGVDAIDLLHVDTEGYDAEILAMVDLDRWRPAVVLFEHLHLGAAEHAACLDRLRAAGYDDVAGPMDTLCLHRRLLADDAPVAAAFAAARAALTAG